MILECGQDEELVQCALYLWRVLEGDAEVFIRGPLHTGLKTYHH